MKTQSKPRKRAGKPERYYRVTFRGRTGPDYVGCIRYSEDAETGYFTRQTDIIAWERVPEDINRALRQLDWERDQSLLLLQQVIKHALEGAYTTELREQLVRLVEHEYSCFDTRRAPLVAKLRALPDRAASGTVEGWCQLALQRFATWRYQQCTQRESITDPICGGAS